MSLRTQTRSYINRILRHANARVESLTAERAEADRLKGYQQAGHFDHPVFPVVDAVRTMTYAPILEEVSRHRERFEGFTVAPQRSPEYTFSNDYFTSPDAEVLYSIIFMFRPATIIEVGSGNSTRLARAAVEDAGLTTQIVSIDPNPRTDIAQITDTIFRQPVESLDPIGLAGRLHKNDVLFIDSSHTLKPCGDVAYLYLRVLPLLEEGVLIHIHDIFVPYEYPREWVVDFRWPWNEQYLVQSMLSFSDQFEVVWAGHYLQRTLKEFSSYFPHSTGRAASSLWLRKRRGQNGE